MSFTYFSGAVALECGVADDKRPRSNVDGTAVLKTEVQRWMSHRRKWRPTLITQEMEDWDQHFHSLTVQALLLLNMVSLMIRDPEEM